MKKILFLVIVLLALIDAGCKKKSDNDTTQPCTWSTVFFDDFQRPDGPAGANYEDTISRHGLVDILNGNLQVATDSSYWAVWYVQDVDGNRIRVSVKCTTSADETGPFNFGVGGKLTDPGTNIQTGYFGGLNRDTLQIFRIDGINTARIASKYFKTESAHTYQVILVIDNTSLGVTLNDLTSGATATINGTDELVVLGGKKCSINGNTIGGSAIMMFDDFKIERCE